MPRTNANSARIQLVAPDRAQPPPRTGTHLGGASGRTCDMRQRPKWAADLRIRFLIDSGRCSSTFDVMRDIRRISGRAEGCNRCFFCVHPIPRRGLSFVPVVSALGPNRSKGTNAAERVRAGGIDIRLGDVSETTLVLS